MKKHPKARCTSTSIHHAESGYSIAGNLTFLGVTESVLACHFGRASRNPKGSAGRKCAEASPL